MFLLTMYLAIIKRELISKKITIILLEGIFLWKKLIWFWSSYTTNQYSIMVFLLKLIYNQTFFIRLFSKINKQSKSY